MRFPSLALIAGLDTVEIDKGNDVQGVFFTKCPAHGGVGESLFQKSFQCVTGDRFTGMMPRGQKNVLRIFPAGDDEQWRRGALPGFRQCVHFQIRIIPVFFKELVKIRLLIGKSLSKTDLLALLREIP